MTAIGMPLATAADSFIDAAGTVVTPRNPSVRIALGGVPAIIVATAFSAAGIAVVSDQTRVRVG
ncbi:MAG: hypothetical protein ACREBO_07265 [Novosphingobium sp.]